MPTCNSAGSDLGKGGAISRSAPTIESSVIAVRQTNDAGFGVFAQQDLPPRSDLLRSSSPAAYVVYRQFRKEVCAWCFRYERGRTWKVRFSELDLGTPDKRSSEERESAKTKLREPFNGGGMVFDSEACKSKWLEEYSVIGLECFVAIEAFIQRQSRRTVEKEADDVGEPKHSPTKDEINGAWESIQGVASDARDYRLHTSSKSTNRDSPTSMSSDSNHQKPVLQKKKARNLADVLQLPTRDPDLLFFILSGILCRYQSSILEDGKERNPTQWSAMLSLFPSPTPYSSPQLLKETTNSYLHLLAILPISLLENSELVSRSTVESILSRDVGNSFGIWSVQDPLDDLDSQKVSDEDPEMLGYAIYPSASFFNHSCTPNVYKQRVGRSWIFSVAAVPVRCDDELTITYIRGEEDSLPLAERRKRLENGWGFVCKCPKCIVEEEEA